MLEQSQVTSSDCDKETSSQDKTIDDLGQSVDHDFIEKILPSGRIAVTLENPPYLFKRRKASKKDGGKVYFSCQNCDVYAHATQYFTGEKVTYILNELPKIHGCAPSSVQHLVANFRHQLRNLIEREPTRSVNDIYSTLRDEFTRPMSEDCMIAFIQEIPTFEMCHSRLYDHRKKFIPRAPRSQAELDTKSAWFNSDNGESLAKIDTTLSNVPQCGRLYFD
jgi:hypothetical protein